MPRREGPGPRQTRTCRVHAQSGPRGLCSPRRSVPDGTPYLDEIGSYNPETRGRVPSSREQHGDGPLHAVSRLELAQLVLWDVLCDYHLQHLQRRLEHLRKVPGVDGPLPVGRADGNRKCTGSSGSILWQSAPSAGLRAALRSALSLAPRGGHTRSRSRVHEYPTILDAACLRAPLPGGAHLGAFGE